MTAEMLLFRNYITDDWKWIATNLRKGREEIGFVVFAGV
jgi:hypothetical protein